MNNLKEKDLKKLEEMLSSLEEEYQKYASMSLNLNMSRGKPCSEQLDLSMGMMDVLSSKDNLLCEDGIDCRNYGILGGIEEAKRLLAEIIEVDSKNIIICGNSSLNVMFDCISTAYTHGILGSVPWCKLKEVKFLCPVPGYDRHFAITEYFGIKMINIPLLDDGPDMDLVEKYCSTDESIKGIWCVPKYSNPTGITYSDECVRRFARLKPKARDFRIYWDNAYSVHHLYENNQDFLLEILDEAKKAGNPDLVYKFTSTSKISFPGSGLAAIASSPNNILDIKERLRIETIGYDKVNQLRHVRFFKNLEGVKKQMKLHANILRPKFLLVDQILTMELGDNYGTWTKPHGGYFISFNTLPNLAKKVVKECKTLGVQLTEAGATYPYHHDELDTNIRIAPSYPSLDELNFATHVFTTVVKKETIKKLIKEKKEELKN